MSEASELAVFEEVYVITRSTAPRRASSPGLSTGLGATLTALAAGARLRLATRPEVVYEPSLTSARSSAG